MEIRRLDSLGQFIDGAWLSDGTGELNSVCPVDQSVVWAGQHANSSQIDSAFDSARKAVPAWSHLPAEKRIAFAEKYASLIEQPVSYTHLTLPTKA